MKTSRYGALPPCKRTHKEALQQGYSVEAYYKKVLLPHEALPLPKHVESISENPSIVKNQHHRRLLLCSTMPYIISSASLQDQGVPHRQGTRSSRPTIPLVAIFDCAACIASYYPQGACPHHTSPQITGRLSGEESRWHHD